MAAADRVRELQEHARVALHGAADVAQQNDRTLPPAPHAAWQRYNVAAGPEALAQGAPDVEAWPAAAHPPARAAFARFPGEPRKRCAEFSAVTVMLTWRWAVLRLSQVPDQLPSRSEASGSGGSPFEKVATTEPAVAGVPQSSTTRASIGAGKDAGTL